MGLGLGLELAAVAEGGLLRLQPAAESLGVRHLVRGRVVVRVRVIGVGLGLG